MAHFLVFLGQFLDFDDADIFFRYAPIGLQYLTLEVLLPLQLMLYLLSRTAFNRKEPLLLLVDEFLHPLQLLTELIIDDRGLLGFEVYFVGEL